LGQRGATGGDGREGDPPTLAPEICVEVLGEANTEDEMQEKRHLYRDVGADEVWVVDQEGHVRFFGEEEREHSLLAPDFPAQVDA
jgi:Uma2 family endonuclease